MVTYSPMEHETLTQSGGDDAAAGPHAAPTRLLGLDGLRGLAVVAVLVFHLWPRVLPGGFIGVSVFFTLSGFVITRALLAEATSTGTIGLRAFWGRRLRRLWPASAVTLAIVVVAWFAAAWMTRGIAIDIGAAFTQVANWRFLLTGQAYGAAEVSPVAHFWSLSIEEQLYLVVPLVVWGCRRRPRVALAVFAALLAASVAVTVANAGDAPVVYYSTFTRAGELLMGAILAVGATWFPTAFAQRWVRRALAAAGFGALLALGWLCVRTSLGTVAYYRGGLTALAALSVLAIVAAVWAPAVARALSLRPLLWLGAVSYGVYLIHWPIRIALLHSPIPLTVQPWITLVLTLVIAPISLHVLEMPVRARRVPRRVLVPMAILLTALIVGGSVIGVMTAPAGAAANFETAAAQLRSQTSAAAGVDRVGPVGTSVNPVRVGVFGDSTALMLALGLGGGDPRVKPRGGGVGLGCPLGRGGLVRGSAERGDDAETPPRRPLAVCDWETSWPEALRQSGPLDVGIVMGGSWDISGRSVGALGNRWATVGDPAYDAWLQSELAGAVDGLHARGVTHVVWFTMPSNGGQAPNARVDGLNALVASLVATRPWLAIVDYAAYLRSSGNDAKWRKDGIHLSKASAGAISRAWLNAQLIEIARRPV